MKIEFVTKNYNAPENLLKVIEKKVNKLDRFFPENTRVKIFLRAVKSSEIMEITVTHDGVFLRAEEASTNMADNVDVVLPKLERQIIKHKTKLQNKLKATAYKEKELLYQESIPQAADGEVVKVKQFTIFPLNVEDAIANMLMLDHDFYVFINIDTNKTEVVYRREDGNFGLLQPKN